MRAVAARGIGVLVGALTAKTTILFTQALPALLALVFALAAPR